MHDTDAKTQKIEPDPNVYITDESFGAPWMWARSGLCLLQFVTERHVKELDITLRM